MLGHSNSAVGRLQSVQMMGVSPHNLERREKERGRGEMGESGRKNGEELRGEEGRSRGGEMMEKGRGGEGKKE